MVDQWDTLANTIELADKECLVIPTGIQSSIHNWISKQEQCEAHADTSELIDTVYLVYPTGIQTVIPLISKKY
jgi:hypothetical protein